MWESKSSAIVMLAQEKEGTKVPFTYYNCHNDNSILCFSWSFQVRCHRYWPNEDTRIEKFGRFEISLYNVKDYSDYVIREIRMVDTEASTLIFKIMLFVNTTFKMCGLLPYNLQ